LKISIVLGTRPEIIKMSPVVRECKRRGLDYFILHTGQHYSHNMDRVFFEQLGLPSMKYNLDVGLGSCTEQTDRMFTGIEKVLSKEGPNVVLVARATKLIKERVSLEKGTIIGMGIFLIGFVYLLHLVIMWVSSGYTVILFKGENIVDFIL